MDNEEEISADVINNWKLLVSKIGDDLLKSLVMEKISIYEKNRSK